MKIKIIFLMFCILLATTWCEAAAVTQANMRISAVDGTAFTDFSAAGTLTPYIGWYLKVYDSTGKTIEGYIKAAGTGETLGSEVLVNGDNEAAVMTTTNTVRGTFAQSDTVAQEGTYSGKFILDASNNTHYIRVTAPVPMALYKGTGFTYLPSGQTLTNLGFGFNTSSLIFPLPSSTVTDQWVSRSAYATHETEFTYIVVGKTSALSAESNYFYVDTMSLKQVLTPSTTGVTIVSTLNGATYNWAVKTTGFNYNDSSGYTYTLTATGFTGSTTGKLQ